MTFGKRGRPPEDRLARQREIYEAVVPLLAEVGAARLQMRDAARAACLSVGGLYYYFPTKHELVLHGLCIEARDRLCQEFHAELWRVSRGSLAAYFDAFLNLALRMLAFLRPSVQAALELGVETFQGAIDRFVVGNIGEFQTALRSLAPHLPDDELDALARGIRRIELGALLDRQARLDEVRDDLRALLDGYLERQPSGSRVAL